MKTIYVSAPWRDVNSGIIIHQICKKVIEMGYNPVCWFVIYSELLNFSDIKNRELALDLCGQLIPACSEMWVFGSSKTDFMKKEQELATKNNIQIVEHSILDFLYKAS